MDESLSQQALGKAKHSLSQLEWSQWCGFVLCRLSWSLSVGFVLLILLLNLPAAWAIEPTWGAWRIGVPTLVWEICLHGLCQLLLLLFCLIERLCSGWTCDKWEKYIAFVLQTTQGAFVTSQFRLFLLWCSKHHANSERRCAARPRPEVNQCHPYSELIALNCQKRLEIHRVLIPLVNCRLSQQCRLDEAEAAWWVVLLCLDISEGGLNDDTLSHWKSDACGSSTARGRLHFPAQGFRGSTLQILGPCNNIIDICCDWDEIGHDVVPRSRVTRGLHRLLCLGFRPTLAN